MGGGTRNRTTLLTCVAVVVLVETCVAFQVDVVVLGVVCPCEAEVLGLL